MDNMDLFWARTALVLLSTIGYMIIAALVWKFAPVKLRQISMKLNSTGDIFSSLFVGFITIPIAIVTVIFLLFTFFGWPIILILFGFFIVFTQIATPVIGYVVGAKVMKKSDIVFQMFIGILILQLITLLPVIGEFVYFVTFCLVVGAAIRAKNAVMQAR